MVVLLSDRRAMIRDPRSGRTIYIRMRVPPREEDEPVEPGCYRIKEDTGVFELDNGYETIIVTRCTDFENAYNTANYERRWRR